MSRLNTIKISNARRLSENVEIDFGEGVTILVAPNGTGKTTIFEALELAITDNIQRLKDEMGTFVNDGAENMSVLLEFDNNQSTKVSLSKRGNKTREGDIKEILDVSQDISISYLFKMTHFFEQNSTNWFVNCDEKEAGVLLSSLPIGRDIQKILGKKSSILTAFTRIESRVLAELEVSEKNLKEFEELQEKLKELSAEVPDIDLKGLLDRMEKLSLKYNVKIDISNCGMDLLVGTWELVKNAIFENKDKNFMVLNKLLAFEGKIDYYLEKKKSSDEKDEELALQRRQKEEKEKELQEYSKRKSDFLLQLAEAEDIKRKIDRIISDFNTISIKTESVLKKRTDLEKIKIEMDDLAEDIEKQDKTLEEYLRLMDVHKTVQEELGAQKEKLINLQKKSANLLDWNKKKLEVAQVNEKRADVLRSIEQERRNKENIAQKLYQLEQNYQIIKENLSLLRKSEEELSGALLVIRRSIGADTTVCPVCQAEYPPGELDKRVSKALECLTPLLEKSVREEREVNNLVMEQRKLLAQVETKLADLEVNSKELENEAESLNCAIERIQKETLVEEDAIELEQAKVRQEMTEQQCKITSVQDRQKELPLVNMEEYYAVQETKNLLVRKEEQLKNQAVSIEVEIENEKHDIEIMSCNLSGENLENKLEEKRELLLKIEKYKELLEECEAGRNTLQNELLELKTSISANEDELSTLKASQVLIVNEGKSLHIGDAPNKEDVRKESDRLEKMDAEMEADLQTFYALQKELAVRRVWQEREVIERKLREQAGDMEINQYYQSMLDKLEKERNEIKNIQVKKKAVEDFLNEIKQESDKIQNQIGLMNDAWRKILKRMIVNPLIVSAPLLENKTSYNKQIAATKAQIHNREIDVVKMASEGQITDLQLSFMLATASQYNWTPWKALLLDEPMQHHDLVHTSSVIDILRDYVTDYGYQVMLSTHDLLQADYFARKFSNDGIKCKIYQLVSREGGVMADRIRIYQ